MTPTLDPQSPPAWKQQYIRHDQIGELPLDVSLPRSVDVACRQA